MKKFFKTHAEDIENALLILLFGGLLQIAFSVRAYGASDSKLSEASTGLITLTCLSVSREAKVSQKTCETYFQDCISKLISRPDVMKVIKKNLSDDTIPDEFFAVQFYNKRESRSLCNKVME